MKNSKDYDWKPLNFAIGKNIKQEIKIEAKPNKETIRAIAQIEIEKVNEIVKQVQEILELDKMKQYVGYFALFLFFSPAIFIQIPFIGDVIDKYSSHLMFTGAFLFLMLAIGGATFKNQLKELLTKEKHRLETAKEILKESYKYLNPEEGKIIRNYIELIEGLLVDQQKLSKKKFWLGI